LSFNKEIGIKNIKIKKSNLGSIWNALIQVCGNPSSRDAEDVIPYIAKIKSHAYISILNEQKK